VELGEPCFDDRVLAQREGDAIRGSRLDALTALLVDAPSVVEAHRERRVHRR
jgi:hypothetical protein